MAQATRTALSTRCRFATISRPQTSLNFSNVFGASVGAVVGLVVLVVAVIGMMSALEFGVMLIALIL
jgi:hypothetical protein